MADKEYLLKWVIDPSKAVSGAQAIERALLDLERIVDRLGPKLKNVAVGASTPMGKASRSAQTLTARLQALEAQARGAATALQSAGASAGTAAGNFQGAGAAARTAHGHVDRFGGGLLALTAGMMVVHQVTKALDAMGDAAKRAREHQEQGAESGLDKRGQARELANLMGESEPNDKVIGRIFGVGQAAGMSFKESLKYLEQFEGSVPAAIKKGHVREDQKAELAEEGALVARRYGLDEATAGDMAGVIGQHVDLNNQFDAQGRKMTAREALAGQMEAALYGANEGRGKASVLVRNEMAQAAGALASGRLDSLAEQAGFVGTASTLSKTGAFAGTQFSQLDNALNRVGDGAGEFLKESGVAGQHGDRAKLMKMKEVLDTARRSSADPATFDANAYLAEHGFGSQQERKAIVAFSANTDVLDKTIVEAEARSKDGRGAMAKNRAYQNSLEGQNKRAEAVQEFGEFRQTQKAQPLAAARKAAVGRLQAQGKLDTSDANFGEWLQDFISGPTRQWAGEQGTHALNIDAEAFQGLAESAKAAGIDLSTRFPGQVRDVGKSKSARTGLIGPTGEKLTEMFQTLAPELQRKGSGFLGDNTGLEVEARDMGMGKGKDALPPPGQGAPGAGGVPAGRKPGGHAANGANGTPGANGQGAQGAQARVEAPGIEKAGQMMMQAARAMLQASRSGGGGGQGGDFDGYEPETPGYGPMRS